LYFDAFIKPYRHSLKLTFENTDFLWMLFISLPLAVLFIYTIYEKKKKAKLLGNPHLVHALIENYSPSLNAVKYFLIILSVLLLILACANLRRETKEDSSPSTGLEIVIVLDLSTSMWCEDVQPSRLDLALQMIQRFISSNEQHHIGLVFFAGKAILQVPLTADRAAAQISLTNASPANMPIRGSNLADALMTALRSFGTEEDKGRVILLVSDGENHEPGMEKAIKAIKEQNITVLSVGVGTSEGGPFKEPGTGMYAQTLEGETVITKLIPDLLQELSSETGGSYFQLSLGKDESLSIAKTLQDIEPKLMQEGKNDLKTYKMLYVIFALAAFLVLILEMFIPETKMKRL
jgi:Ca-activated chloride channel family protein